MSAILIILSIFLCSLVANTLGAEVLYSTIADWCGVTEETVVLDICCGTGTIGISMARVRGMLGAMMCITQLNYFMTI